MAGEIQTISIESPSGPLEALLNLGAADATHAGVVCHPHPLYGGTMHNKVVFHAMKVLNGFGFSVLRFNFRGAGLSQGTHDEGRGEVEDVRAALDWLDHEFHLPVLFAGFSFGAATGLRAACPDMRVAALIALGTPVTADHQHYRYEFLMRCPKPKLFVSGTRDEFGPRAALERLVASAVEPKRLVFVEGANHFFEGHLDKLKSALRQWLQEQLESHRL